MGEVADSARLGFGDLRADLGCLSLGMDCDQGLGGLRADFGWAPLGRSL